MPKTWAWVLPRKMVGDSAPPYRDEKKPETAGNVPSQMPIKVRATVTMEVRMMSRFHLYVICPARTPIRTRKIMPNGTFGLAISVLPTATPKAPMISSR